MPEIKVLCSGAFKAAYLALLPAFEHASGHKVVTAWGGSVGGSPSAIPDRLARGEPADAVILSGDALDRLIVEGKVANGSRTDLARSGIAVAVRAGARKPEIASSKALVAALLAAQSVGRSASASGVYLDGLFQRLGIRDQIRDKVRIAAGEPVGACVARGEVEIGFQQMSELLPVKGIEIVGPLPPELQQLTAFSAGIVAGAREPEAARALIAFLTAPDAAPAIRASGMEPA
jgi:molybdate transport system substrate-binding protein